MADADLGVVPKRADSFGNEAYSTKIMEFMSIGVPVVVSGTAVDRYYFDDTVVRFFESGNDEDLANALCEVLTNRTCANRWSNARVSTRNGTAGASTRSRYLQLIDALIDRSPIPAGLLGGQAASSGNPMCAMIRASPPVDRSAIDQERRPAFAMD